MVARGDVPILIAGYGMANHELGAPNRADTKFGITSLTKAFTAVSILQLAESRKLDIADGICRFLDRCPAGWDQVTIEHLLAHISGIPDYTHFPGYVDRPLPLTTKQGQPGHPWQRPCADRPPTISNRGRAQGIAPEGAATAQ